MKKLTALLLGAAMAFSLAACSGTDSSSSESTAPESSSAAEDTSSEASGEEASSTASAETASCIYTQKGNKKIRKPQAANQTALIFDRRAAARLLSINSIRRLCWS